MLGVLLLATVPSCFAASLCDLIDDGGAILGFSPASSNARAIIDDLGTYGSFSTETIKLQPSTDARVRSVRAAAQLCKQGKVRYIFYDPDFIKGIESRPKEQSWAGYFIIAHELAHHINGDTLDPNAEPEARLELNADRSAAEWLTRRGAMVADLLAGLDALDVKESDKLEGYPGRCERRAGVIRAYNEVARQINEEGGKLPIWQICNACLAVPPDEALYLAREAIPTGASLLQPDIVKCGTKTSGEDVPRSFKLDVAGMCSVNPLKQGDRLTWNNIGVCALLHK